MDHFQIEVCEIKEPTGLSAIEVLGLAEVSKVLMVSEDLNRGGGALKVMPPSFQSVDDGEEFPIKDIIISFNGVEGLREVRTGMPIPVGISLEENGSGSECGSVCGNGEGAGGIRKTKNRFGKE